MTLPGGKYGAILADPPWHYNLWQADGVTDKRRGARGMASTYYPTMSDTELKLLPVADFADTDACLFMWATWPRLEAALELGRAWGFRYVTNAFLWTKLTPRSINSFLPKYHFGLGNWTRANTEPCLFFVKGHPRRQAKDVAQLIVAPVGRHSAKPVEAHGRIERLVSGPYLELFARSKREGWHAWGNEIENDVEVTTEDAAAS